MKRRRWFRLPVTDRRLSARDVDTELGVHLAERVDRLMAAGLPEAEARAEAERRLGGLARARYALVREAWERDVRLSLLERLRGLLDDVRYAARAVSRERGYAAVVIITLALGIGANATMFGIVDRLLLSGPAHVVNPDGLHRLYVNAQLQPEGPVTTAAPMSGGAFTALRANLTSMENVAGYVPWGMTLGSGLDARPLSLVAVSASFFPLLGVRPALGRFFDEAEAAPPEGARVIVISHELWQREFGGSADAIGATLPLGDHGYTVVGVAPAGFTGVDLEPSDGWVPLANQASSMNSANWDSWWMSSFIWVVGRIAPDATPERAAAEATAIWRENIDSRSQPLQEATITLGGIRGGLEGNEPMEAQVARWLLAVSAIVLAIACANVANLYFARGLRRRREIAVRLTLGISRARLIRLLLMEGMLLAVLGGTAALLVAWWGAELVRGTLLPDVDWTTSPLNTRVLVMAAGVTVLVGVLTGLVPALQATSRRLAPALTGSVHAPPAPGRTRNVLAAMQAAFCVLLLVGAGLFVNSLAAVERMDLGVDADRVLLAWLQWPVGAETTTIEQQAELRQRQEAFVTQAAARIQALPGVERAAVGLGGTFAGSFGTSIRVDGRDSIPRLPSGPYVTAVTAGYFETLGTPLVRGRVFEAADDAGAEAVVIINRTAAETLWPGADPLERCVYISGDATCNRVIGVVGDVRRFAIIEEPAIQVYTPYSRRPAWASGAPLYVRASLRPQLIEQSVRRELHSMDPSLRFVRTTLLADQLAPHKRAWTLGAMLFGVCGLLALTIAAIGLYSVIAYLVLHRRHEIGVRVALGAERRNVVGMVLRQALGIAGVGLAIGIVAAFIAAPWLEPLLFDTAPRNAPIFAAAAATLAAAALVAGVVPAWRAARVAPTEALRES